MGSLDPEQEGALVAYFRYRMRRNPVWLRLTSWTTVLILMGATGWQFPI